MKDEDVKAGQVVLTRSGNMCIVLHSFIQADQKYWATEYFDGSRGGGWKAENLTLIEDVPTEFDSSLIDWIENEPSGKILLHL
jgi:hypothetical protein